MNSEYKKYSLDNLKTWIQDSLSSGGATPKEIYDAICEAVNEEYYIYKHHTSQCYELLALLKGNGSEILEQVKVQSELLDKEDKNLSCDKDDKSPECQQAWTSFWEEHYYPEEVKDDGMRPWGHSDLEYGLANDILTKNRISNFPGEQYTEEELNAMCDKAASDKEKEKCREYNLREAEYYDKRAELDINSGSNQSQSQLVYESPDGGETIYARKLGDTQKTLIREKKVKKWILPVQQSNIDGSEDYYVNFPDDLLKAAHLKEGDEIEWVEQKDGSYRLKKVFKVIGMEDC